MVPWTITFIGTGSAYPTPKKGSSCTALSYDGNTWLFDTGEGTQTQIMKSDIRPGKISKIFITHLHGDHLFGLPGLLCTISQCNMRDEPVELIGPEGLAKYVRTSLCMSRSQLGFKFNVTELIPTPDMFGPDDAELCYMAADGTTLHLNEENYRRIEPQIIMGKHVWKIIEEGQLTVNAVKVIHRVPSFSYAVTEQDRPGKLDVNKAKELGVPLGPVCSQLKAGYSITLDNGNVVTPNQVVGPSIKGRKIVVNGDSSDSTNLAVIGQDADAFIHEATLEYSMREEAVERGHSTPAMAAQFAKLCNSKTLYLTHFSQRYTPSSSETKKSDFDLETIRQEAIAEFGENVVIGQDLASYEVKFVR